MKLSEVTLGTVQRAVAIFLDLAYGSAQTPRRLPDLSLLPDATPERVLDLFHRETCEAVPGHPCARFSMRLGNRNYPFMKLMLQEHLVAGEFFFAVDTHDEMEIRPDFPDYEAWMSVRRFNLGLKREIERQFATEGLDTAATIRDIAKSRCGSIEGLATCGAVLVVDDEEDLAETVENLLRAKGYKVFKVFDGAAAVRAARDLDPDLVVLDYELPEMDGLEVMQKLREDEVTRETPVLLASAGRVSLDDIAKADGFLAKPFQEGLLYTMVERLVRDSDRGAV